MAGEWIRDGAVQDQIDDTVLDAVAHKIGLAAKLKKGQIKADSTARQTGAPPKCVCGITPTLIEVIIK